MSERSVLEDSSASLSSTVLDVSLSTTTTTTTTTTTSTSTSNGNAEGVESGPEGFGGVVASPQRHASRPVSPPISPLHTVNDSGVVGVVDSSALALEESGLSGFIEDELGGVGGITRQSPGRQSHGSKRKRIELGEASDFTELIRQLKRKKGDDSSNDGRGKSTRRVVRGGEAAIERLKLARARGMKHGDPTRATRAEPSPAAPATATATHTHRGSTGVTPGDTDKGKSGGERAAVAANSAIVAKLQKLATENAFARASNAIETAVPGGFMSAEEKRVLEERLAVNRKANFITDATLRLKGQLAERRINEVITKGGPRAAYDSVAMIGGIAAELTQLKEMVETEHAQREAERSRRVA